MSEQPAVLLEDATKIYRLQDKSSPRPTLGSLFGFGRRAADKPAAEKTFVALDGVSLSVARGERIGLVGRNGAGKTTLLKLLCGNFTPTSGRVVVNGSVQALMTMGTGFHPDHTGRRNAEMSLKYNDLSAEDQAEAMRDVEEFCELGVFFDQPFKTYSLGMQARLMFAVATAVKPEILIIDEVLGAGDAYFVAKSKLRVERLVKSGCTMILVSHSMSQILELCTRAIWLDQGRIRMNDDAFLVVKAYEEYMHGPINAVQIPATPAVTTVVASTVDEAGGQVVPRTLSLPVAVRLQEPTFLPHADIPGFPALAEVEPLEFMFLAPGGISRWESQPGLKVCGFSIVTERGITNELVTYRPVVFIYTLIAEIGGDYNVRHGIAINDYLGNCLTRIFSPKDTFSIKQGELRQVRMMLNPNQLGPGNYVVGISVLEFDSIEKLNSAARYDLLSRSFLISVALPDSLGALSASMMHSAEWQFGNE